MSAVMRMSSARPYLLRAMHAWITDNKLTAYLLVNAEREGVLVPRDYAVDGKIVLNISGSAVRALQIGNDDISFSARFGGQPQEIRVPIGAVEAIYAKENGQGMVFNEEADTEEPAPGGDGDGPPKARPHLTIVK